VTAPSGQQHRISSGDQEAVVVEVGAGLRTFTAARPPGGAGAWQWSP